MSGIKFLTSDDHKVHIITDEGTKEYEWSMSYEDFDRIARGWIAWVETEEGKEEFARGKR